jgi:hypothetical protein
VCYAWCWRHWRGARRNPPTGATDPSTVAPVDPRSRRCSDQARRARRQVRRTVGQRDPFSIPEVGRKGIPVGGAPQLRGAVVTAG